MLVILEGPDGAGKSTLARLLSDKYGLEYRHEGPPPKDCADLLVYYGNLLAAARGKNILFDRLAFGELIYGPILRNSDLFTFEHWRVFRRLLRALDVKEVYCMPSYEVCKRNWLNRKGELFTDTAKFERVYRAYTELTVYDPIVGGVCYDYTAPGAIDYVYDYIEDPTGFQLAQYYIGSPAAKVLLVGDRGASIDCDLPFFGVDDSSGYLTHALDEAGFTDVELAWVNAWHHLPRADYTPILSRNSHGEEWRVIALGNFASWVCGQQRVKHSKVVHPQYQKRFHFNKLDKYAASIKNCIVNA